jgi:guanylate kinase
MMDKYKIVALFGEAGSGKDYIQKKIIETDFGKNNLSEIISCTTRPPREGELDGVHYHFIPTAAEFFNGYNLARWIEFANFRNWWYGTSIEHLNKNKINIGVFNIKGINQILEDEEIDCLPIRVKCIDKIRLIRQLNRESNPDCLEICRRFQTDTKDFLNIPFSYKVIENNTNEINPITNEIKDLIIDKWPELNKTY